MTNYRFDDYLVDLLDIFSFQVPYQEHDPFFFLKKDIYRNLNVVIIHDKASVICLETIISNTISLLPEIKESAREHSITDKAFNIGQKGISCVRWVG